MIDQFRLLICNPRFHLPRSPPVPIAFSQPKPSSGSHDNWYSPGLLETDGCLYHQPSIYLVPIPEVPFHTLFFLWVKEEENGTYIWAPTQWNFLTVLQRMEPPTCYAMQPSLSRNPHCDTGPIAARKNSILRKLVKRLCS